MTEVAEDNGCLGSGGTMTAGTDQLGFRGMTFAVGTVALKRRQKRLGCPFNRVVLRGIGEAR